MIISYYSRFIFFAVPKTGTQSIRYALRAYLHDNDWEQCSLFEKKSFPVKEFADLGHGHLSYQQLASHFIPQHLDTFFKFAFVRNPYDRFVSTCYFINRTNLRMKQCPLDTMKSIIQKPELMKRVLFLPQYSFLCDNQENIMMDYIGRLEYFEKHCSTICQNINIKTFKIPRLNNYSIPKYHEIFDTELKELIGQFYSKDFKLFGYDFE